MARRKVDKDWDFHLVEMFLLHPQCKAPQYWDDLHKLLGDDSPGLSTIQKCLAKIRERYDLQRIQPLSQMWSISTLPEYPIEPEALPIVLKAYRCHAEQGAPLTIREAQWISRLYKCDKECDTAEIMEYYERISWLLERPVDMTDWDRILAGMPEN